MDLTLSDNIGRNALYYGHSVNGHSVNGADKMIPVYVADLTYCQRRHKNDRNDRLSFPGVFNNFLNSRAKGECNLRRYKWIKIIGAFLLILISGIAIWRGVPPFTLHNEEFPGLFAVDIKPQRTEVKIYKSERKLVLYGDEKIIGAFKIALGFSAVGDKEREGDGKTPEGKFVICYINDKTPYLYFYGLNYPNFEDAERGLKQGLISREEYQKIVTADRSGGIPLWNTSLGGEVGIHGGGNWLDWTKGCVAVSDADILTLKRYMRIGTSVEIFP